MRIIAYITKLGLSTLLIEESTDQACESSSPDELLSFLLEPYEDTIKVCWSLDETVAPLLRFIGKENCIKLYKNKKLQVPPYDFFYVPGKVFILTHLPTRSRCSLYGIDQYYPDIESPKKVQEIQWLGQYLIEELHAMEMYPTKLTSPAAIYEECVMRNFHVPTMNDMPKEAAEYAYRCSGKLWIENYQIGYWDTCYDYDIKSSFPTVAKGLLDFRYGEWVKTNELPSRSRLREIAYGYCKCDIFVHNDTQVSPYVYINSKGESSTPTGEWPSYITKDELTFLSDRAMGKASLEDAWWFIPNKSVRPLEKPLEKLLAYRGKGKLRDMLAKRMSVGLYGKFGEEHDKELGAYFNPCWFAEISTQVRLQVAEFIYSNKLEDNLIHVSIDGLLADRQVEAPAQWRCEPTTALVLSSGLVFQNVKRPHGLTLDDVLSMIQANPLKGHYEKAINKVVTLGNAIEYNRLEDLGLVKPHHTSIDLYRLQQDRQFAKLPRTGQQLLTQHYKSKPSKVEADRNV